MTPDCGKADVCSVWKSANHPFIGISNNKIDPDLIIVGEAPGEDEDLSGLNFVGDSGKDLRNYLSSVGFDIAKIGITNTVKCRPIDGNKKNRQPTQKEINCCKNNALVEIQALKPKLVILMGNIPAKAYLGVSSGITSVRGQIYDVDGVKYLPTFHPASVFRNPQYKDFILKDLATAYDTLYGEPVEQKVLPVNYELITNNKKLVNMLKALMSASELSFDIETNMLSPFFSNSKIVCVSFSAVECESYVLPLYHSDMPQQLNIDLAWEVLKTVNASDIPKYAHFGKFDCMWLQRFGAPINNFVFDTGLAQYLLSEERSTHNLGYCSWQYTDMGSYYGEFESYVEAHKECNPKLGGSYENVPWSLLVPYSGGDADCCLRCKHKLEVLLESRRIS